VPALVERFPAGSAPARSTDLARTAAEPSTTASPAVAVVTESTIAERFRRSWRSEHSVKVMLRASPT
jgi:hypothetical protein